MIDKTKFNPRGFYDAMRESKSLLVRRDELRWTETFEAPGRPVEALLAFGCAVQHTPHLMMEATAVFDALGIDYAAVTGRQFCCGRPFQKMGGSDEAADMISGKSYERFVQYQPQVAVQWCGACMMQYLDVIGGQTDPPFDVMHVTSTSPSGFAAWVTMCPGSRTYALGWCCIPTPAGTPSRTWTPTTSLRSST